VHFDKYSSLVTNEGKTFLSTSGSITASPST
jgi:hypothetical protein